MKRLLIHLILLLLGLGGGVGAGFALSPRSNEGAAELANPCGDVPADQTENGTAPDDAHATAESEMEEGHGDAHAGDGANDQEALGQDGQPAFDYVKLNNQFVVPLLTEGQIDSLVLLSLSIEVPAGKEETVLMLEPKLRDVFLQVLFDHANTGGFDGMFTAGSAMRGLRDALLNAAEQMTGGLVTDVLVLDLVRQDQ